MNYRVRILTGIFILLHYTQSFSNDSFMQDMVLVQRNAQEKNLVYESINSICDGNRSKRVLIAALCEAAEFLVMECTLPDQDKERIAVNCEQYFQELTTGTFDVLDEENDNAVKSSMLKTYCMLKIGNLSACTLSVANNATVCGRLMVYGGAFITARTGTALTVVGNTGDSAITSIGNGTLIAPALTLINNAPGSNNDFILTITPSGVVTQGGSIIPVGCQPGPLTIGTSDSTTLTLVTDCLTRLAIDGNGAVTISQPSAGEALTVDGNIVLPVANAAGTQGQLKLGGTSITTNVSVYEVGTRNFFAGNGLTTSVTGTDNISIGTSANSSLTTANNAIAIGSNASATGTDSVAIGNSANTTFARTIVIGSKDSTGAGVAPTAGAVNAIAIGTASGAFNGPSATGLAALALGGSGGTFNGASASGDRSIAIGVNAISSGLISIAIGSASATAGGSGASATGISSIAMGSGNGARSGPQALADSSCAIGSANTTHIGAVTNIGATNSIALGNNAATSNTNALAMGTRTISSGVNALAIGSGTSALAGATSSGLASIAIGGITTNFAGPTVSGDRAIGIGINANTASPLAIVVGSASGTVGGSAATASASNAIAFGGGNGALAGANASGLAAIAIGGSCGVFSGPISSGSRSIALGCGARATADATIAIGTNSGNASGIPPTASGINAVAIGSANAAGDGASAAGLASVALGGASSGTLPGASVSAAGVRSVALGSNANTAQADAIVLGNPAATALRVGIGIVNPASKLRVNGVAGTPVVQFDADAATLASAPVLTSLVVAAAGGADNYLAINASNQVFRTSTVPSSKRYKENFRSFKELESNTYKFNPLMFDFKPENGGAKDNLGFIAEEVAEIFPSVINYDNDGKIHSIKYECFHALAIKEIQKHQLELDELCKLLDQQALTINILKTRIKMKRAKA